MSAPYRFDRYRNGRLMAEGIKINKENCLEDAIKVAARLADHGDVLVYDVAIAAALAKMGAVQVKPLVWTAKGYAQTPFGKYLVVREDWSGQEDFWFVCFAGKPYGQCGEHSSEEAAKAAAQADYEARIIAAIEPAPVQRCACAECDCDNPPKPKKPNLVGTDVQVGLLKQNPGS